MKNVGIIASIGPSSGDIEILKKMIDAGMTHIRLNFSHGSHAEHKAYILNIIEAAREKGVEIPIIQDLSGPRVSDEKGHKIAQNFSSLITEKDLNDLEFGLKNGVDMVAMSYVGEAKDIRDLKKEMENLGKVVPVIAKIEREIAVENVDEIIAESEAIMIARGDLGREVALEKIPFVEREILHKCNKANTPAIVATEVLYSMTKSDTPTRAEMTDIAFAVLEGADIMMLSDETTTGKYPLEAVSMMKREIEEAKKHSEYEADEL